MLDEKARMISAKDLNKMPEGTIFRTAYSQTCYRLVCVFDWKEIGCGTGYSVSATEIAIGCQEIELNEDEFELVDASDVVSELLELIREVEG